MTTAIESQHQRLSSPLRRIVMPMLIICVGIAVLVYPVMATQWNNHKQARVAEEYSQLEQDFTPEQLSSQVEAAREYNANRAAGPILDPWLARITDDNADYQDYRAQLNLVPVMARIVIPSIAVDLPIYHGTEEDVLAKGVGHLYGSDLPVGGLGTHTVLTGHTGMTNATLFDNLTDLKEGQAVYISVGGEKLKYEVHKTYVVLPEETDTLRPRDGEDLLTLITCTPYGINTHRLLVEAHRVPMDETEQDDVFRAQGPRLQLWMWLFIAGALTAAALLGAWVWFMVRGSHRQQSEGEER